MSQSAVIEGPPHVRKSKKHRLLWLVLAGLLLSATCWMVCRPHTAVVVTIDEIGVDATGIVTVTWSPQARRDAKIVQGCADVANPEVVLSDPVQQKVQGIGLLDRWRSTVRNTTSIQFASTDPDSVELLVEKGRRYFLRHGDTLALVRAERVYEGRLVRHEMYVAVTPP